MAKIRRRIKVAKVSHQLDLSTKACWPNPPDDPQLKPNDSASLNENVSSDGPPVVAESKSTPSKQEIIRSKQASPATLPTTEFVDAVAEQVQKKVQAKKGSLLPELMEFDHEALLDHATLLACMASTAHKHAFLSANVETPSVEFILFTIPTEVFKMTSKLSVISFGNFRDS